MMGKGNEEAWEQDQLTWMLSHPVLVTHFTNGKYFFSQITNKVKENDEKDKLRDFFICKTLKRHFIFYLSYFC